MNLTKINYWAFPVLVCIPALIMSGCLARNSDPSLPYIKPAHSVPYADPTAVHISARIDDMEKEIQRLRQSIESLENNGGNERTIKNLQERVTTIEKQIGVAQIAATDNSGKKSESQKQAQANPVKQSSNSPEAQLGTPIEIHNAPVAEDERLYREAYDQFKNGNFDQSTAFFEDMLKSFPQSTLAADAIYWIGETKLAQKKYEEAVLQFDRVLKEFPGSKKELNALLKQGEAFEKMGDDKSAKIIYQRVINDYPHTAQGRIASSKLKASR